MKNIIVLIFTLLTGLSFTQTWNFIGSNTGISNATEVDIEISASGQIFMAYIDVDNSNKATVRKWYGSSWILVGSAGITSANSFDLQLVLAGENPVVGVKVYTTYEAIEVFSFNGTTWNALGLGMYLWSYHTKDFAISVNTTNDVFLSFFSRDYQTNPAFPYVGLITAKLNSNVLVGGIANNPLCILSGAGSFFTAISAISTTGNNVQVVYHENQDLEYGIVLNKLTTNTTNPSNYINNINNVNKIHYERGTSSSINSMMHSYDGGSYNILAYRAYNGTTFGLRKGIDSSTTLTILDYDFVTNNPTTYVFYKKGTTSYLKELTGDMAPTTLTTIASGSGFVPTSSTSLQIEQKNTSILVIAYVSAGKCYVKEQDAVANIEDYETVSLCEQTGYTNGGNAVVYCLDDNYSHANLSMTVTSQNTSIIPQSAISTSAAPTSFNLNWRLFITNTNDVSNPTVVEIRFDLFENGVIVSTYYMPVTVYPKPEIQFLIPNNEICENTPVFSLNGKATPPGGTWFGPGVVSGNNFNASIPPIGSNTIVYTVSNSYGCSNSQSTVAVILESPELNITTTNADCGLENGSASVAILNGLAPYEIDWSTNATTNTIIDLEAGQYFVVVEDANGCKRSAPAMVGSNGISQTATIVSNNCHGESLGEINLTVVGAVAPVTIEWSNGGSSSTITNLTAGNYEVTITDATGCVSVGSYEVLEQPAIVLINSVSTPTSQCNLSDGEVDATAAGGSGSFDLNYYDINGNQISNNPLVGPAGYYSLVILDQFNCQATFPVIITSPSGPSIALDTLISSSCANDGAIQLVNIGNNATNFEWSNGATTLNVSNLAAGNYGLEASDANGCISSYSYVLDASQPIPVSICLVTVDTATNTNLLVWEKPITNGIAYFNIYRETSSAGVYQLIDTVNYTSLSQYTDPVADPSVRSWRYKISSVDACGTEGEISDYHKTIHLNINIGLAGAFNLSWDQYEGFGYPSFNLYRYTTPSGWVLISSLPTNLFDYTDTPANTNGLDYFLEITPPSTCTSTKVNDFNSSRSNRERGSLGINTISEFNFQNTVLIYPNPSNDKLFIDNFDSETVQIEVTDLTGKIISNQLLVKGINTIPTSNWENGIYIFTIESKGLRITHRQIIQH